MWGAGRGLRRALEPRSGAGPAKLCRPGVRVQNYSFSFRGATVRNSLDFSQQFARPAKQVTLEQNDRSSQPILAAANSLIARAAERDTKELGTAREGGARPRLVSVQTRGREAAASGVLHRAMRHGF